VIMSARNTQSISGIAEYKPTAEDFSEFLKYGGRSTTSIMEKTIISAKARKNSIE
jgi:hypothetical protein